MYRITIVYKGYVQQVGHIRADSETEALEEFIMFYVTGPLRPGSEMKAVRVR